MPRSTLVAIPPESATGTWAWVVEALAQRPAAWVVQQLLIERPASSDAAGVGRAYALHAAASVAQSAGYVDSARKAIAALRRLEPRVGADLRAAIELIKLKLDFQTGITAGPTFDFQRAIQRAERLPSRTSLGLLWRAALASAPRKDLQFARRAFSSHFALAGQPGHERGNGTFILSQLVAWAGSPSDAISLLDSAAEDFSQECPRASPYFAEQAKQAHLLLGYALALRAQGRSVHALRALCAGRSILDRCGVIARFGAGLEAFNTVAQFVWTEGHALVVAPPRQYHGMLAENESLLRAHRRAEDVLMAVGSADVQPLIEALGRRPEWQRASLLFQRESVRAFNRIAHLPNRRYSMQQIKPFIVHGRDVILRDQLKNFLQNRIGTQEPVILSERPNKFRTIIEKFEGEARACNVAFALLTPDDAGHLAESGPLKSRARQNVVFELGYFAGRFGRRSGRLILIYIEPLELPSDLHGIVYINATAGLDTVKDQIRQELESCFGSKAGGTARAPR